jgi:hypothetical protein
MTPSSARVFCRPTVKVPQTGLVKPAKPMGERQAEHLNKSLLFESERLEVRRGGNDEHAGGAGEEAGRGTDERRYPRLDSLRHRQMDFGEPDRAVDDKDRTERDGHATGVACRQQPGGGQSHDGHRQQHRPKPAQQEGAVRARRELPHIRQQRGDDDQRRGLGRRHEQAEHTHGDGRQAHAGNAFDDSGKDQGKRYLDHEAYLAGANVYVHAYGQGRNMP